MDLGHKRFNPIGKFGIIKGAELLQFEDANLLDYIDRQFAQFQGQYKPTI